MQRARLRTSEWVLIFFFGYVTAIAPFFRERPSVKFQPVFLFALIFALVGLAAHTARSRFAKLANIVRDWLPLGFTLLAFREMELFVPSRFDHHLESRWIQWDDLILREWHFRALIEGLGRFMPLVLESSYLLVYGIGFFCIALPYFEHRREQVDRFLTVYLTGTLLAYAFFPYFPSEPPRILFPDLFRPAIRGGIRSLNLWLLNTATIHVGVFPSAHVSSAFSAAWFFLVYARRSTWGLGLLAYAIVVSVATVYGRYHYAADVFAGFAISLAAALVSLLMRRQQMYASETALPIVEHQPSKSGNF